MDIVEERAQETADIIADEGGAASAWVADVSRQAECKAMAAAAFGLTVALAAQLGDRLIRVNAGAPGQVYTPLVADRLTPEGRKARASLGLIKEEGTAWDIGWASVFLASDEARWITGQTLHVDAGISIKIPGGQPQPPSQ